MQRFSLYGVHKRDYQESDYRTDRRTHARTHTHRQTPDKVIPMCRYASQATQKTKEKKKTDPPQKKKKTKTKKEKGRGCLIAKCNLLINIEKWIYIGWSFGSVFELDVLVNVIKYEL